MRHNIKVCFRDGTNLEFKFSKKDFDQTRRTKQVRYEGNFAIVVDEYFNETAFPADIIQCIVKTNVSS